jgi:hypothetical protein
MALRACVKMTSPGKGSSFNGPTGLCQLDPSSEVVAAREYFYPVSWWADQVAHLPWGCQRMPTPLWGRTVPCRSSVQC